MIEIKRNGKYVQLDIEIYIPRYHARIFNFYWDCGDEIFAGLLSERLGDALDKQITEIKRQAYNAGYKDGRAKRAKKSFFSRLVRADI